MESTVSGRRTQKARSVESLSNNYFTTPDFEIYGIEQFIQEPWRAENLVNRFVRPCPVRPRHGFVDSRPVHTLEEAQAIIAETYAVETEAEIIAMPFIDAEFSAIWTEGSLTIGPGTDGATTGRESRTIPVFGVPTSKQDAWQKAKQDATITEAPYVEMLWRQRSYARAGMNHDLYYVQLRNGPKLPHTVDFIPAAMEVKNIVVAEGDLLKWESDVKTFPEGTVVHHPGGSLASHYAVHAVLNNVPVLVSREPKLGETLEPCSETPKPDVAAMRAGFYLGATTENLTYRLAAFAMLAACHSTTLWLGKHDGLLGFGMGCAYRLTLTAALGEMRHQPGRQRKPEREAVYERAWDRVLTPAIRYRYIQALESFGNDAWPSSFGGRKWYEFSTFAGEIYNALVDGDPTHALEALNKCVNAAHNGGWAFDKFLPKDHLDIAAVNPCAIAVKAGPVLYSAIRTLEANPTLRDSFRNRRHYDIEEIDAQGAERLVEREEEDAPLNACPDCGNTYECCSDCHSCPDGYDDPEPVSDNSEDAVIEENKELPIIEAQAKFVSVGVIPGKGAHLHIQYKRKGQSDSGKGYYTEDYTLTPEQITWVKQLIDLLRPVKSWASNSSAEYIALDKGAFTGSWRLKSPDNYKLDSFYLHTLK